MSGDSDAAASLASLVSDPAEKTSFSAPSIFMPPGLAGFSRIGRVSAVTTGTSPDFRPINAEAPISVTNTAPRAPANMYQAAGVGIHTLAKPAGAIASGSAAPVAGIWDA